MTYNWRVDAFQSYLSDLQKAAAKRRASEAGRPYPNLIDNAWAANKKA